MAIITDILPKIILPYGGTTVVITGSGFVGTTRVVITTANGQRIPVMSYQIYSDYQIVMVSPKVDLTFAHVDVEANGSWATTPIIKKPIHADVDLATQNTYIEAPSNANAIHFSVTAGLNEQQATDAAIANDPKFNEMFKEEKAQADAAYADALQGPNFSFNRDPE